MHTVSVNQTWIVYRKRAKHLEHVKPPWNAPPLSGSQPRGERRIEDITKDRFEADWKECRLG